MLKKASPARPLKTPYPLPLPFEADALSSRSFVLHHLKHQNKTLTPHLTVLGLQARRHLLAGAHYVAGSDLQGVAGQQERVWCVQAVQGVRVLAPGAAQRDGEPGRQHRALRGEGQGESISRWAGSSRVAGSSRWTQWQGSRWTGSSRWAGSSMQGTAEAGVSGDKKVGMAYVRTEVKFGDVVRKSNCI